MRSKSLYLHIYKKQLGFAAVRCGFEDQEDLFFQAYSELEKVLEPVSYYEYNYPARNEFVAVITLGPGPDRLLAGLQLGEQREKEALEALCKELLTQSERAMTDFVRQERRVKLEKVRIVRGSEQQELLANLAADWPELPVETKPDGELLPSQTLVYRARLGRVFGCTNGGSCASCPHPTCGKGV